ncbi:F-box/LRR-repeat protein At5g63520 isoform X2 [Magnolia sinica]|uniref:F-box/LRR-repeat protein At5g63520 isoform X2 n=1 Tax=Magnolia sinica TaxID=86752 RepID=UPI00265A01CE|nr:F-box/LRR-repeat protein At5g63520 isoform X2 [Magnolia sinica]
MTKCTAATWMTVERRLHALFTTKPLLSPSLLSLSLSAMETTYRTQPKEPNGRTRIASLSEDLLRNILCRLPAPSYACATCACRSWRHICNSVLLSRPKLLSSLSLNPNLQAAVEEASEKVLSEPIRPHFVIAFVGRKFSLDAAHQFVRAKFSTKIPVITCLARGIIGKDALSNEFKEWNPVIVNAVENGEVYNSLENRARGIVLVVGFLPGLKVNAIPLRRVIQGTYRGPAVESFLDDIKTYTASVSDCTSPMGIVMFADHDSAMGVVLEKMDFALGGETVVVGDESGCFVFSTCNEDGSRIEGGSKELSTSLPSALQRSQSKQTKGDASESNIFDAVALVFAKDRDKPHGIGEIHLDLALSTGLSTVGSTYKAASVRVTKDETPERCTWLTARREGSPQSLDGQSLLSDLDGQMGDDNPGGDCYIGVVKQRKLSKAGKGKLVSSFVFHEVISGDEEYLFVGGEGIRTGDPFRFYIPSVKTALKSITEVTEELQVLKNREPAQVFGGLIFSCCGRGRSFFEDPNVDSSAFLENFPDAPLAGMFCMGEIGRRPWAARKRIGELNPTNACLHAYSTVFLVMSFAPEPLQL